MEASIHAPLLLTSLLSGPVLERSGLGPVMSDQGPDRARRHLSDTREPHLIDDLRHEDTYGDFLDEPEERQGRVPGDPRKRLGETRGDERGQHSASAYGRVRRDDR